MKGRTREERRRETRDGREGGKGNRRGGKELGGLRRGDEI